MKKAHYSLCAY